VSATDGDPDRDRDRDRDDLERLFDHHLESGLHHGAQLAVYRGGDLVVDVAGDVARPGTAAADEPDWDGPAVGSDTRFLFFSCTKPYAGSCVHHLVDRGKLAYDDRLVEYRPDYAEAGTPKATTTVRHVLSHQAGVPEVGYDARPDLWADADAGARAMAEADLAFEPGEAVAYHASTYGWLLRELVRRVAGTGIDEYAREHVFDPLGMDRTAIGSPHPDEDALLYGFDDHDRCRDPDDGLAVSNDAVAATFNDPAVRRAVGPASTGAGPAREMARFYACIANGGALDGTRLLSEARVAEATAVAAATEDDGTLGTPRRNGLGFERAGAVHGAYGTLPPGRVVGHAGLGTCVGWADPERELGVAYLTNGIRNGYENDARASAVSDAVRRALD